MLRDPLDGAELLELGHLVDDVDHVGPLLAPAVPEWTVSTRTKPGLPSGRGFLRVPIDDETARVFRKESRPVV